MPTEPRVTLIMFAYQQEQYIRGAVSSALAQDYGNLHIVFSDDASSDTTYRLIQDEVQKYQGSHRITVNQNPHNLGIAEHFNKVMNELVDGELVIASAGDDYSDVNRVSRVVEEWLAEGKPELVAHNLREINERGESIHGSRTNQYKWQTDTSQLTRQEALRQYLSDPFPLPFIGAALAYKKSLFDDFGTLKFAAPYEDHIMYFRALTKGRIHYFDESLVSYRIHSGNFTNRSLSKKPAITNEKIGEFNLLLPSTAIGAFRLHLLCCQQFEDYCHAVHNGFCSLNIELALRLLRNIEKRHKQLVFKYGSLASKASLMKQQALEFISSLGALVFKTQYRQKYAIPYLRTISIIIFGASAAGSRTIRNLPSHIQAVAFSDNNKSLFGKKIQGLPVIEPAEIAHTLTNENHNTGVGNVLIASIHYYDIKAQLLEQLNIPNQRIARAPHELIVHERYNDVSRTTARIFFGAVTLITVIVTVVF